MNGVVVENKKDYAKVLALIEAAELDFGIEQAASYVSSFHAHTIPVMLGHDSNEDVFSPLLDRIKIFVCEKIEEIFSPEELDELIALYNKPIVKKFIFSVNGNSKLYGGLKEFVKQLCDEIMEEQRVKLSSGYYKRSSQDNVN